MFDAITIFIVPIVYFVLLQFAPNGIWKSGTLRRNSGIVTAMAATQLVEIKNIVAQLTHRPAVTALDGSYQVNKIQHAIHYTINRHDWYETQRSAIITKLMTFSGLAFTALALYSGGHQEAISPNTKVAIINMGLTIFVALIYSVNIYNSELDQDRPYRLVSDIRHWYFRYSLPDRVKDYGERGDFTQIANDVLEERNRFFDRALGVSKIEESIREDLEQLFILHILVKHKSESLQKLRWSFFSLILILSISGSMFLMYIYYCET
jgi:hypothetical protein